MDRGPVYLKLLRGRESRVAVKDIESGHVFGPYQAIRFSDHEMVYLDKPFGSDLLRRLDQAIYYDGVLYREWVITSASESDTTPYDPAKVDPTRGAVSVSALSLEERFRRLCLLCESLIEDRLSILCEQDPDMRDILLTSDIEDQIGHWQAAQKELMDLK